MSSCDGSIRSRVRIPLLEFQSCFTRGVRHGANAPVIQETAAVEHDALDALLDGTLRDGRADRLGALEVSAADALVERALDCGFDARRRRERPATEVVDDLRVDVREAAEHAQARPLGRSRN